MRNARGASTAPPTPASLAAGGYGRVSGARIRVDRCRIGSDRACVQPRSGEKPGFHEGATGALLYRAEVTDEIGKNRDKNVTKAIDKALEKFPIKELSK
jgi:hypothetical protein